MKFYIPVFALMALGFSLSKADYLCKSDEPQKKAHNFQEIVSSACNRNTNLNRLISSDTFDDIMRAIKLLEDGNASVTESDKANKIIIEFIEALKKEFMSKIEEVKKNENFYQNFRFLNFIVAGIFALFASYDHLPHFSNEFLERNVHSKDNHCYALIAWATGIFFLHYKALGYQNERIALEDIEKCITQLKESLEA